MKRSSLLRAVLIVTSFCILLPALLLLLWSVTARWAWPSLLPQSYTLRTVRELFFGSQRLPRLLASSIALSGTVGALSTVIGLLTARAVALYRFAGRELVRFGSFLPLLIPGSVFAIGIQLVLLRLHLADTVTGVLLVHLVAAVPYSIIILLDVTTTLGDSLEQQAAVLGAPPLRAFCSVSLPQLMPGVLSSFSMAFILSYSQYFTTLIVGGGRVKTISLVLVPYIQSGDRALASVYTVAFVGSALLIFFLLELLIHHVQKRGDTV